jgi:hypothetical protein
MVAEQPESTACPLVGAQGVRHDSHKVSQSGKELAPTYPSYLQSMIMTYY